MKVNYYSDSTLTILTISTEDLATCNLQPIMDLYNLELKWDHPAYHHRLFIDFLSNRDPSIENMENQLVTWYQELLKKQPEALYFLVPEQLVAALVANLYQYETDPYEIQTLEKSFVNKPLKSYILQTLEDLIRFENAPNRQIKVLYEQVNKIDTYPTVAIS